MISFANAVFKSIIKNVRPLAKNENALSLKLWKGIEF